jgi:hypothetical protein
MYRKIIIGCVMLFGLFQYARTEEKAQPATEP